VFFSATVGGLADVDGVLWKGLYLGEWGERGTSTIRESQPSGTILNAATGRRTRAERQFRY